MGIYVYTLRKRFVNVNILGEVVPVHAFSYLMKRHINETRQEELARAKADSLWDGVPLPKFAFSGDWEDLMSGAVLEVSMDIKSHIWWDVDKFPGTGIGGVVREGRGYRFLTSREYLIRSSEDHLPALAWAPSGWGRRCSRRAERASRLGEAPARV